MTLNRPTTTPIFLAYPTEYALGSAETWDSEVGDFDPNPITIPPYQRKIVWDKQTIKEFFESNAAFFGTVILARTSDNNRLILLDGLQRFATATAVLTYLLKVLFTESDDNPSAYFPRLKKELDNKKPLIDHNDNELRTHTRKGVMDSYVQLYDNVESIIHEMLFMSDDVQTKKEAADKITATFLKKQIAIDMYYGFKNEGEFIQTFININATGIDLSEVDLLRSEIIQQAEKLRWEDHDIDEIENRFTEIFQSNRIKPSKILGKHLYDMLKQDPTKIFKNWNSIKKDDIDDLFDFIEKVYQASTEEDANGNKRYPYLYENLQCGDIPFAMITWFYYKKVHLEGKDPDFLGGTENTSADLLVLLRAFYRRIIESSMNRVDSIMRRFIEETDNSMDSIKKLANKINDEPEGSDSTMDNNRIRSNLRKTNKSKIQRIFNACLLPLKGQEDQNFGPLKYGTRDKHWTISHIIPKINEQKDQVGYEYIDNITNYMPIPSNIDKQIKKLSSLEKIQYLVQNHFEDVHPYVKWLVTEHYSKYKNSDPKNSPQNNLESLRCLYDSSISEDRLQKIIHMLSDRI